VARIDPAGKMGVKNFGGNFGNVENLKVELSSEDTTNWETVEMIAEPRRRESWNGKTGSFAPALVSVHVPSPVPIFA
jgi:hypothetical protein